MRKVAISLFLITLIAAGCEQENDKQIQEPQSLIESTPTPTATINNSSKQKTKLNPSPTPTTESSSCDPNYSGCVPISSDVDCAGGSGNGPAYVRGPVNVIGFDIYDLDRDGNGIGCE